MPCFWLPKGTGLGATATLASTPVPLKMVCCGLAGASSATLTVAVRAPAAPGVKVTLMTHDPPLAVNTKLATQVVPAVMAKSALFAPVMVTGVPAVRVEFNVPELVTVRLDTALVVPSVWLPKGTGLGATATLASTPVPLRVVCCGLAGASSATLTVAVRAPAAPGVKVTLMTHDPPLAVNTKLATQVVPAVMAKSALFAPVMVTGVPAVRVEFNVPELVTVRLDTALVVPSVWLPKGTGLGATATLASTPVPLRVVCCGLAGASSATFTVAVRAPAAAGVKVTLMTQEPPLAVNTKPATQVVPEAMAKSPGLVPVMVTGVPAASVAFKVPELVTVMV